MELNYNLLKSIANNYGESFYILDEELVKKNFLELKNAFADIYPKVNIAYSYKTNYTPRICKLINELGGYAEVVSDMEYEIAKRIGVNSEKIIFNGPYKNQAAMEAIILNHGYVNIDSQTDFIFLKKLIVKYADENIGIGIRCNFDVEDGVLSRFGIDVDSELFAEVMHFIKNTKNLHLKNLHCHFATRSLAYWENRAPGMFEIVDKYDLTELEHIDLGGGLFGKMADSLRQQFQGHIPSYEEYAKVVASQFAERYANVDEERKPELIIEPGSAIVGDVMKFAAKVINIKNVRGKDIATVLGSIYNINPTLNTKNPPVEVFSERTENQGTYEDIDFGGFTCIESDYLYRHFSGKLAVNDYAVFGNVGSYSVVLKPPFILPNFAIVSIAKGQIKLIKRQEKFDDLFHTFVF